MTIEQAEKILALCIKDGSNLSERYRWYLSWTAKFGDTACLDGDFTANELEAIVVWMREKKVE